MPDAPIPPYLRRDGPDVTLVVATAGGVPAILYWGPRLADTIDPLSLAQLAQRAEAPASPFPEIPLALTPLAAQGWPGRPGLAAHRGGHGWASLARLSAVDVSHPDRLRFEAMDDTHGIALRHDLKIENDLLLATTTLTNTAATPLTVDSLAAPVIPLPAHLTRIIGFEGRWGAEFQTRAQPRHLGTWVRENRRGRTSHDSFPALIATEASTTESLGVARGFHLAWSGNHRLASETLPDGRALVMLEALYLPGEIRLAPGEALTTPTLYAAVSDAGLGGLTQAFHRHLRARPNHPRTPRRVHYNSWEAVYFDHDPVVLADLATRAAAVGAERFVLDDGWFQGRRGDSAGLGDWIVDPAIYPQGLEPLIAHVESLGMDFGLWVEPESVNPDSDLFRAHPDWVLATPPAPQIAFRHQYVLDFGRAEVRDHLFTALDTLLRQNRIAYLKWDMNRDISQPGTLAGSPGAHAHVLGLYEILDRLRAAHPALEIESCASGGGRADLGILQRTDRIWTSDSNDALDRLAIQRGFGHVFPAELMGAHVGPSPCHTTGRRLPMALRVATAMFGHMGVELDLRALAADELATLAAGIALHKTHRTLIHSGDLVRLDAEAGINAFAIIAADRSEALLSWTCVTEPMATHPQILRLAGLDALADYSLALVWPPLDAALSGFAAMLARAPAAGAILMQAGFQPPRCPPGTALVIQLVRVS